MREDVTNVLTALPVTEGASIGPGTVVAEMSGRPIILMSGERPFYRDLRFEDTGPDVSSLQRALGVTETGTFDAETQTALADLYTSVGYSAPVGEAGNAGTGTESQTPDEVLQPLRDALEDARIDGQASIDSATLDLEAAKADLADGSGTQSDVDASQRALGTGGTGP